MRTYILFILLFIWGNLLKSQNDNYYSIVNKAEMLICQGNYTEADKLYKKAFDINKNSSIFDRYNSLIVLSEINDNTKHFEKIIENLEFLVSKAGLTLDFFEANNDFEHFKRDSSLWISFLDIYPKSRKDFINNADFAYREYLNLFGDWDQSFRRYDYYKFKPYNKSDSLIFNEVLQTIDKHGYPFYNIVGLNFSTKRPYLSYLTTTPIYHNILHAAYRKDKNFKDSIIPKWFSDKFLEPELVGYLLSLYNEKIPIEGGFHNFLSFMADNSGIYDQNIPEEKERLINKYRKKYSLCTIQDHKNKLLFQLNNPKFILVPHSGIVTIKGEDPLIPFLLQMGEIKKLEVNSNKE